MSLALFAMTLFIFMFMYHGKFIHWDFYKSILQHNDENISHLLDDAGVLVLDLIFIKMSIEYEIFTNTGDIMDLFCTNCGKKFEGVEECTACKKPLGTTGFVCVKTDVAPEHFCSKKCSHGEGVDASYQPKIAKCKNCKTVWELPKEAQFPIPCPQCKDLYTPPPF